MIDLNQVFTKLPPPHRGAIVEQRIAPEGWLQICFYASNLAEFPEGKRQDLIVWGLDLCNRLTNSGEPSQFIILEE